MHRRFFLGLLAVVAAGQVACVDPVGGGSTGDTALYVHSVESGTTKIQVFTDANALFAGTTGTTPARTLTSSLLSQVKPLAWGGMVLDSQGNRLYLVGESGTVVRIDRLRNQTGDVPTTSTEAVSFTLGQSSDRLSSGKFGQAALDAASGTLYVTEANDSESRIWIVTAPGSQAQGSTVTRQLVGQVPGDKGGMGVAAGQGSVYASFRDGNPVGIDALTGPRLRKGSASGFPFLDNVLVGSSTQLGAYGTLALDTTNSLLYVARHNEATSTTTAPVLVFRLGQFAGAPNQAPDRLLGSSSNQPNLRFLTHAGSKDWLAGGVSTAETGTHTFWLWKNPQAGGEPVQRNVTSGAEIRGMAFDGNN